MSSTKDERLNFPVGLKTFLGFYLNKAALLMTQAINEALSTFNLRIKHYAILQFLSESGPAQQKTIGNILLIDRNSMVNLVDELEAQKLIVRARDSNDRRAYAIGITQKGMGLLLELNESIKDIEDKSFRDFSKNERLQLELLLEKLLRSLLNNASEL